MSSHKRSKNKNIVVNTTKANLAVKPRLPEVFERKKYTVSFSYHNTKESDLEKMSKAADLKKVFKFLICVCDARNKAEIRDSFPMESKPIRQNGDYKRFWNKIGEDVEMLEVDVGKHRCIYFLDELEKIVYVVAIAKHPENDKNKR